MTGSATAVGRSVAITRPAEAAVGLAGRLRARGVDVLLTPAIRREAPASWAALDRGCALLRRGAYDGVLFTSPAAVGPFLARLDGSLSPDLLVGAVGSGTAAALAERGVSVHVIPEQGDGLGLAGALIDRLGPRLHRMRFLQPRAAEGRRELSRELTGAGATVDVVDAYRTLLAGPEELAPLRRALEQGAVGAVVYASPSAVRAVVEALGSPGGVPAVAIGGTTAVALQAAGAQRIEVAERPDDEALEAATVAALLAAD